MISFRLIAAVAEESRKSMMQKVGAQYALKKIGAREMIDYAC